jgi:hypothetical protein
LIYHQRSRNWKKEKCQIENKNKKRKKKKKDGSRAGGSSIHAMARRN